MKAIMTRIFNAAKKTNQNVDELGKEWFKSIDGHKFLDANEIKAEVVDGENKASNDINNTPRTDKPNFNYTEADLKVTLPENANKRDNLHRQFDDANRLLLDIVRNISEPNSQVTIERVKREDINVAIAKFPTGKKVEVVYDYEGNISRISSYHDNNINEVALYYEKDNASVNTEPYNSKMEHKISSDCYDWDKLVEVAEYILGKDNQ